MTRFERDEPLRGAASERAHLSADLRSGNTGITPSGNIESLIPPGHATANYVAFYPPSIEVARQNGGVADNPPSPVERVKAGLRDSPNPIADITQTLNSIGNLNSFHAVYTGGGSHHVTIGLNHSATGPAPIGVDRGRHHAGGSYTDTKIEADVTTSANKVTIDVNDGLHAKVYSDRIFAFRQRRLGQKERDTNTHRIEISTDAAGHGLMHVESGVVLPRRGREKATATDLREQNLPPGPMRELLGNPAALQNVLRTASLFRPDQLREYSLTQPTTGQFEISTTAQAGRDVTLNLPIKNSPATLQSIHLDPTVKATLVTGTTDGQQSVSLAGVGGITFNVDTGVKPPLDKVLPAKVSVAPKSLTLHNVDGKDVVSYELENPPGSGKIMSGDIPLAKLLEAQKEPQATRPEKPVTKPVAKPQDGPPKTQEEYVKRYIDRPELGGYTADRYKDAYEAAQKENKPLVVVLDRSNDPKTLEAAAAAVARQDAIVVYANVNKLPADTWMTGYAREQMAGPRANRMFLVQNLPNGNDKGGAYSMEGLSAADIKWVINQRRNQC